MVRWDSPLFTTAWDDDADAVERTVTDIWNAVTTGTIKKANPSVVPVRPLPTRLSLIAVGTSHRGLEGRASRSDADTKRARLFPSGRTAKQQPTRSRRCTARPPPSSPSSSHTSPSPRSRPTSCSRNPTPHAGSAFRRGHSTSPSSSGSKGSLRASNARASSVAGRACCVRAGARKSGPRRGFDSSKASGGRAIDARWHGAYQRGRTRTGGKDSVCRVAGDCCRE